MSKKKSSMFYKEYLDDVHCMNEVGLTEQQVLENEIYDTGAYAVYRCLWKFLVRRGWTDKPGYPIKREYYDKGLLACSFSRRKLLEMVGGNARKLQNRIKLLEEAGWIKIENKTFKGQRVFILGEHKTKDDIYSEILFKNNREEIVKIKEGVTDLTGITNDDLFRQKMAEQYGDLLLLG